MTFAEKLFALNPQLMNNVLHDYLFVASIDDVKYIVTDIPNKLNRPPGCFLSENEIATGLGDTYLVIDREEFQVKTGRL